MSQQADRASIEVDSGHGQVTIDIGALRDELNAVQDRLAAADATLRAIRDGEVDAVVVDAIAGGERVFTLSTADRAYRTFVENMPCGAATVSADGIVLYANPALACLVEWSDQQIVGHPVSQLVVPASRPALAVAIRPDSDGDSVESLLLTSTGKTIPVRISSSATLRVDGDDMMCIIVTDLSHEREAEAALAHLAQHDALTRLPNRLLLADRIQHALDRRPPVESMVAVLFCDVDGFKSVNDEYGHRTGDDLLRIIAQRLSSVVRPEDTVARIGGDEFVVLLDSATSIDDIASVAARMRAVVAEPIAAGPARFDVSMSIGIAVALIGDESITPEALLHDADEAMYKAKRQGPNVIELFDEDLRIAASSRLRVLTDIRHAASRGELRLYYQPVLELESETPIGVEALLRWQHPRRGLVLPGSFIPFAESSGLMPAIGTWVVGEACRQAAIWADKDPVLNQAMAINVSGRQLTRGSGLIEAVRQALDVSRIDPSSLILEVTESALLTDAEAALGVVNELKSFGVRIAIDDFGIGYSSLVYLKRFPVDILKIDRSFVRGLVLDHDDRAIIRSIIDLARAFGITTVAEGVESHDQLHILQDMGCAFGQGWLWSRAVPPLELATHRQLLSGR
jgi:diguanylate cyclase (GGDEF)-like protein/PAS domain S-box-containing protein